MVSVDDVKRSPGILRIYNERVALKKNNAEYIGVCPFHSEKTGSFTVFQFEGAWLYKCHGCGASGNGIQFVERMDRISFKAALDKVRAAVGVREWENSKSAISKTFKPIAEQEAKTVKTFSLDAFASAEKALAHSKPALDWLESRGILYETAKRLHVGFRQDVGGLAGPKNADIAAAGWIAFPCIQGDKIVSVKYRSIARKAFTKQPGMATALYNSDAISPLEPVVVVEGEVDALSLEQSGFRAVSLPSGSTKLSPEMKDLLLEADSVILAGDADEVGASCMLRLWNELQERTFLLKWPEGMKDANDALLKHCGGDKENFQQTVEALTVAARSNPIPGVYGLQESMLHGQRVDLQDHPDRFRFPWPSMDGMVNIMPGSVVYLSSTNTGMGKTAIMMEASIHNALRGEVVLNYSAELDTSEYALLVASHLLRRDRNALTPEDFQRAYHMLQGVEYYIGHNPDLTNGNQVLDLIEAAIRRLSPGTVILDHFHAVFINEQDTIKAQENGMGRIKNMARKYGVKWINLGQPRKADQKNKGKAIHTSDAKGSESIISTSDAAFALHRDQARVDDPNNPPKDPYDPLTKIFLQKGRSQGKGNSYTELIFRGNICSFFEKEHQEPPEFAFQKQQ
jgi:5S rRNA maturation endonuclease (ribonuclease M5)